MINLQVIGETLDLIGVVLVAYAALSVHHRFKHEHKVDDEVFRAMNREQFIAAIGVASIVVGYILKIVALT